VRFRVARITGDHAGEPYRRGLQRIKRALLDAETARGVSVMGGFVYQLFMKRGHGLALAQRQLSQYLSAGKISETVVPWPYRWSRFIVVWGQSKLPPFHVDCRSAAMTIG
jgi:hypothetical protein